MMGIMKWIARKGAVGGTARWAAKMYHGVIGDNPDWTHKEITLALIEIRYFLPNDLQIKESVISNYNMMKNGHGNRGAYPGLFQLVICILTCEAGFSENTSETQRMFMHIITEELEKLNVPTGIIEKEKT
jgi:hypothetical protein